MNINNFLKNEFEIFNQLNDFDVPLSIKINVLKVGYIILKIKKINYFKAILKTMN